MSRLAKHDKTLSLLVLILSAFSIASFFFLSSSPTSAESRSASVTVGSACTLSAVENTAHTATIPSGTNQSDIGRTTFSMVCNDSGGFSIYAIGYASNELGNTKLIASINGSAVPSYDINTGSNASGTPSSWAMKLTPGTNLTSSNILNGYGSYSVIPSVYTKVATLVPSTAVTNTSTLEATYRVNVASTQPAGNYNGKVRYVMVNPNTNVPNEPKTCSANKICYWPNGGDTSANGVGVPDTMGDQSIASSATSATLWASNFKREGYGFAGWSDAYDYVVNVGSESNPDAHIYGPNETIDDATTIAGIKSDGLSLYAVWVKSEGNLQGWNGCSSLGSGEVTALTDVRDNDTYAVAKLIDGNCWMIENLRLDYDNSDNFTGALAQGYGVSSTHGDFIGLAKPETSNFTGTTSSTDPTEPNSLYYAGVQVLPAIMDISQVNNAGYRIPRYRNDNTNTNSSINPNTNVANMTGANQNVFSYGNYYTWSAAIADTKYYGYSQYDDSVTTTSLCPQGWLLPQGGGKIRAEQPYDDSDFWNLIVDGLNNGVLPAIYDNVPGPYYNSTESVAIKKLIRKFPNNFVHSGYASGTSISFRGNTGQYWSSTIDKWDQAFMFSLSSEIYPGTAVSSKYSGNTIRCIVRLLTQ